MSYRRDEAWDAEVNEEDEEPRRGWLARVLIVALLAATGSGSALLWRAAGGGSLQSWLPGTTAVAAEKNAGQADIDALKQQIAGLTQSSQQLLAAQQAEIKRLSDQIATLSGKLDLMQRPVAGAQAAIPAAKPPEQAPAKKRPEPAKPLAAAKPEPKPDGSKPAGTVTTGSAPLQLTR